MKLMFLGRKKTFISLFEKKRTFLMKKKITRNRQFWPIERVRVVPRIFFSASVSLLRNSVALRISFHTCREMQSVECFLFIDSDRHLSVVT